MTAMNIRQLKIVPALCLDWDNTIRRSKSGGFINNWQDIELMPGVEERIWAYRDKGYKIIGVSNQGGVAYGHKTEADLEDEKNYTLSLFKLDPFHLVQMCNFMEGCSVAPFNQRSLLRKPHTGMLAVAEHLCYQNGYVLDWDNSLFVGDRSEDEECAAAAKMAFMHIDQFLLSPGPL